MIYLTGSSGPAVRAVARRTQGLGLMVQPGTGIRQIPYFPLYAADNGCFNPKDYVGDERWLKWVDGLPREGCLFVVVPDVARRPDGELGGDPVATWERFEKLAPKVADMGFPTALAAQNGIEDMANLNDQLAAADCLFLAGSTEWKESKVALDLARYAQAHGLWAHMARVNTERRYRLACSQLVDSADGTILAHGPGKNLRRVHRWLDGGAQLRLAV